MPCSTLQNLPLWPLAAKQTKSGTNDDARDASPEAQGPSCSTSDGTAYPVSQPEGIRLQSQLMYEEGCEASAHAPPLWAEADNVSDSHQQIGTATWSHLETSNAAGSQPGNLSADEKSLQRPHELIGRELFITASMLNHSCEPNCVVVREAGHAKIVSQGPIEVR